MHVYYDDRETLTTGLAGGPENVLGGANYPILGSPGLDLWSHLNPGILPRVGLVADDDAAIPFWDRLYLIGKAPQSQYDALRSFNFPDADAAAHVACLALTGNNFHGQNQRQWQTRQGNIHLSISVPLDLPAGPQSLVWTMVPAVAIIRAFTFLGMPAAANCGIKWVNDVLWEDSKVAGVISSVVSSQGIIQRGFLGIGLNVAQAPDLSTEDDFTQTTCLHHHLPPENTGFGKVLWALLDALANLITQLEKGDGETIVAEYQRHSLVVGRQVQIMSDPVQGKAREIFRGKILRINPDLSLVVEGMESPIHQGRLFFQD